MGIDYKIFSLKRCRDRVIHDSARDLMNAVDYTPFIFSHRVIMANLKMILKNPFKYLSIMLEILVKNIASPKFFFKSLAIFPKSVYYALEIKRGKAKHIHAHWATIPATSAYIASRFANIRVFACSCNDISDKAQSIHKKQIIDHNASICNK